MTDEEKYITVMRDDRDKRREAVLRLSRKYHKLNIVAVLVLLALFVFPSMAWADTVANVEVPFTLKITGSNAPQTEPFHFVLEPITKDAPMPENSQNNKFILEAEGAGTHKFPAITYDDVGEFEYRIYQQAGDNPEYSYDTDAYLAKVIVLNGDTVDEKEYMVLFTMEGQTEKVGSVVFANGYNPVVNPTGTPTGGETGTPTGEPTANPTGNPTGNPTVSPTSIPKPTAVPKPTSKPVTTPVETSKSDKIKTGDDNPVLIWICIMEGAAIIILLTLSLRTKRKHQIS